LWKSHYVYVQYFKVWIKYNEHAINLEIPFQLFCLFCTVSVLVCPASPFLIALLPLQFSLKAPSSGPEFVNLSEAEESIPQAYGG
jgi:hypothetical protein